jgi:putative peptidoglycan lipid II flippase
LDQTLKIPGKRPPATPAINERDASPAPCAGSEGGSINLRILLSAGTVSSLTGLVAIATLGREVLTAAFFGTGDEMDAFLIALLLCKVVSGVLGGAVNAGLAPVYIQVKTDQGQPGAQQLLGNVLTLFGLFLLVGCLMLAPAAPYLLRVFGSSFPAEKLALAGELFYLLLPTILLGSLAMFFTPVLNANGHFGIVAATPIITPVISMGMLVVLGSSQGIYALAQGVLLGSILELCLLVVVTRKLGLGFWFGWSGLDAPSRQVVREYFSMVVAVFLLSCTALVDQTFAASLGAGSVSVLVYANKGIIFVLALAGTALRTALLPSFAAMIAKQDWKGIRFTVRTYVSWAILGGAVLTILVLVFGSWLVRILFQRGAFTAADTERVAVVQAIYALQIPAFLLTSIVAPLVSSLRANHVLMINSGISLVLCVILDYVLMTAFGLAGIALATAIMYAVSFGYLSFVCFRILRRCELEQRP